MSKKNLCKLPDICILKAVEPDSGGNLYAEPSEKPAEWGDAKIMIVDNRRIKPPLASGDEFIARINHRKGNFFCKPIARTSMDGYPGEKIYGIIEKKGSCFYLKASEKNIRFSYLLDMPGNVHEGDFVSASLSGTKRYKQIHILKNFGRFDLNKATASLILDKYDIPCEFDDKINKELVKIDYLETEKRDDFSILPLVTIDGDDSKDFDDAVWAERAGHGFNLIVAIADVGFYVRPNSELDREAYKRGNSVYLPNMVIPMLPEKLSNELCSLMPQEKRAAMVCLMQIDHEGKLLDYEFKRGIIKSAARLTYREVQNALDGERSTNIAPVFNQVVKPLYEAYLALDKAKTKRGALNLETTEIKVKAGKAGEILSVSCAENLTAHKIVEEFMITANVAAALALKKSKLPVMYRVHDRPPEEKLADLKPLLETLKLKLPDAPALKPAHLNRLIEKCGQKGLGAGISDLILRTQSQAQYSPENIGHFGLGLKDYVHFTSPIRRYADLLIHRALVRAYDMPDGGALEENATVSVFEDIGRHLCETERKAVNAERDLTARFVSSYLQPSTGQVFEVKITGLSTAGIFVRIENIGAEGLIPLSSMPADFYELSAGNTELKGAHRQLSLHFGEVIQVRLLEASPITGGLIFKFIDPKDGEEYIEKGGGRHGNAGRHQPEAEKASGKSKRSKAKKRKVKAKCAKASE